ncbi:benzoate 4-monooxygenase cytochrome P450 [Mollisia scopiformis]|uniref:Benzoate 4-monooxygenase cytochrome P450 n=1 Tax=Mollisia scopiformis TaxID=149040 RepID=A0A194WX88_MOLSC|nr:benzoate 4-monooxygenase cytochrome P450 [Mollisia scopiformis]KUJ12540.1 benzoate 4-monooxygenase cytochrome P450 [Mollisia scopiformis]
MDIQGLVRQIACHWLLVGFSAIITYFVGSAIYNVYFSPLAKYPGPFFAKVSGIPSFYHALTGHRHVWIWQCHQIYGDVFRFQPNGIMVNSPTGYQSIYGTKANVKKGKFYEVFPRNKHSRNTLNTVDRVIHAHKRRVLNAVFSETALRSAETFIISHVDRWVELLVEDNEPEVWTEPKDISPLINWLFFDILGDLCFGRSFESKEKQENPLKSIPHTTTMFFKGVYPFTKSPILQLWVWLKPRGLDFVLNRIKPAASKQYGQFVMDSVMQRTKQEQKLQKERAEGAEVRTDMFHYLFQAKDPKTGGPAYTPIELFSEASLLIIAGTDTSAVVLCAFFFYITRNPRAYRRLTKEIRETFGNLDEIKSGPKLSSCRYLSACIDEALRMCPPLPSELPREVLSGGLVIDGQQIPQGVNVGTSGWSLMHHDEVYGDPWVYRPERWIADEASGVTTEDVTRAQRAFYPFSAGVGNCAGKNLAMKELLLATARTLFMVDVKAPPAPDNLLGAGSSELGWGSRSKSHFVIEDAYLGTKDGPMLQLKRRTI